jgi:histidinol-phosphate aminotransferase
MFPPYQRGFLKQPINGGGALLPHRCLIGIPAAAMAARMNIPVPKSYISAIHAYTPGKAKADDGRALIKLSANENPLGCSADASGALAAAKGSLARYPDPASGALRAALAAKYGLEADRIVCGTGSDELLNLIAAGYAGVGDEIIHVKYGFAVYDIATRKVGAEVIVAPDADYGTDTDALLALVGPRTRLVYLANPNNPTGTVMTDAQIEALHAGLPPGVILVLDQAYGEYLESDGPGAFDLARKFDNVLITRTFSKIFGLAAERIGWAYGKPHLIDTLNRIRGPFNVTSAGQAAAIAALADTDFTERSRAHNAKWRDWMNDQIAALSNHGLRVVPSAANFILVIFGGPVSAEAADRELIEAGYVVRRLAGQGLGHALRITIGTEAENLAFMDVLRKILEKTS